MVVQSCLFVCLFKANLQSEPKWQGGIGTTKMTQQVETHLNGTGSHATASDLFEHDPLHLARLIIDSAVDFAIVTLTPDGTITSWNEGAERIMGWTAEEAIGQSGSMFFVPEDVKAGWPEYEMRVAASEGSAQDERWHLAKGDRRFWASGRMMLLVSRSDTEGPTIKDNRFGVPDSRHVGYLKILRDRTEDRLRSLRRTALLDLGDRLRDMTDEQEIAALASETLGRTLGVTQAGHGYLDRDGLVIDVRAGWGSHDEQSLVGRWHLDDFGRFAEELRRGEIVVIEDCRTHPAVSDLAPLEKVGARASLNVPLIERGRVKAVMCVHDAKPRTWTKDEIRFVRGVADRTYAAIDRTRSEAERNLVTRELAHRMKNLLAIAQVIAGQSLRHASTLEEGRRSVTDRLTALGRAQDMLTDLATEGAGIRAVVRQALAAHVADDAQLRVEGPDTGLHGQQVLGLTLALHELATNAGKYGALSVPEGSIDISWTIARDHAFSFVWKETGGPAVVMPHHTGFGSQILNRVTGSYFHGTSKTTFEPDGVRFTVEGSVGP